MTCASACVLETRADWESLCCISATPLHDGKGLICDTKTDSLATRNHPPFYLRSDTKSDSFATHTPLGSIGGTGDRGQGLGGTGVRGDKGLS